MFNLKRKRIFIFKVNRGSNLNSIKEFSSSCQANVKGLITEYYSAQNLTQVTFFINILCSASK